jgi:diguanylate cyclase (GGDEF)-like protein
MTRQGNELLSWALHGVLDACSTFGFPRSGRVQLPGSSADFSVAVFRQRRNSLRVLALALAACLLALLVAGAVPVELLFALPLICCAWAARAALGASRRGTGRRLAWGCFAVMLTVAVVASTLGMVSQLAAGTATAGLYVGLMASVGLAAGSAVLAAETLRTRGWVAMVDPLLLAGVVMSLFVFGLVLPGFDRGDYVLTAVLVIDLVALVFAAASAAGPAPRAVKAALLGTVTVLCVGDGAAAGEAAGIHLLPEPVTPLLWALAAAGFGWAALRDDPASARAARPPARSNRDVYVQVLLPLGAIVGYPAIMGLFAIARGGEWFTPVAFFGPFFLASTAIAFSRQALLLVEQRRAAERERLLSAEALRRTRELEAITGLASTMTEVLEERPVIARGLKALQMAARTTSCALHLADENGALTLAGSAGDWWADREDAPVPTSVPPEPVLEHRNGRHAVTLPVVARGRSLGALTLMRPEGEGPFTSEFSLLGLLADQLAVALQNTRDHQEKLEAAIRDPLTGLYNRRFFYEAFSQEIARHDRYGGAAALVLFDIDDFRLINDELGSQTGDDVLEEVGRILFQLVRPSDTFARIGGEEFGLLMPQTGQLDALLVAERLRTAISRHKILDDRAVTISGGVAALPQDGTTREELQRRADQALYWAKRNGKNMCAVASEAIADDAESIQEGMLAHLHGVVAGIDAEHLHTRDHSENVASYAVAIGQELGLDSDRIVRVRRAAFLHDIGKVAVCHTILGKPAGLTDDEFEAIKVHPQVGETILHHAGLHDEARWVGAHHERLDGRGYPHGLRSSEIPLEARIIFVADSFEAMTSDRPYRRGMPVPDAIAELRRCAGTQFDPRVVATLAGLVERGRLAVLALRDPS